MKDAAKAPWIPLNLTTVSSLASMLILALEQLSWWKRMVWLCLQRNAMVQRRNAQLKEMYGKYWKVIWKSPHPVPIGFNNLKYMLMSGMMNCFHMWFHSNSNPLWLAAHHVELPLQCYFYQSHAHVAGLISNLKLVSNSMAVCDPSFTCDSDSVTNFASSTMNNKKYFIGLYGNIALTLHLALGHSITFSGNLQMKTSAS